MAYDLVRWKNVTFGMWFYNQTRKHPRKGRAPTCSAGCRNCCPKAMTWASISPRNTTPGTSGSASCPMPICSTRSRRGKADIVTDTIDRFEAGGIRLTSGDLLEADIIVAATGLKLEALGGMAVSVDGVARRIGDTLSYKGMMFSGIPNLAVSFGYINASWTLRSDLIANMSPRLLSHMKANGVDIATPTPAPDVEPERLAMDLSSGYVQRGADALPRSGNRAPWMVTANYKLDKQELKDGALGEEMRFAKSAGVTAPALAEAAE